MLDINKKWRNQIMSKQLEETNDVLMIPYSPEENKFETLGEFKDADWELMFEYNADKDEKSGEVEEDIPISPEYLSSNENKNYLLFSVAAIFGYCNFHRLWYNCRKNGGSL